jgi:CBS domain-containing protein
VKPTSGGEAPAAGARRLALTMYSPLSAIVRPAPVTVPLDATVREALEAMERRGVGSIVVADRVRNVPLGIFTLQDLLRRVTLPGGDLAEPIACVMTSGLITLAPEATAHEAALTMARNGVGHVVVVDGDARLVGVVSQADLFGLQRMGVKEVSDDIRAAADVEALARAGLAIRRLTGTLLAQGTGAELITHLISTLNDLLTIRIIELTVDEFELPPVPLCWIAAGSEGRLEQTVATDQDNGLVFDAADGDVEEVRARLLPFAKAVNQKLHACGFPLCQGEVMAGNPRWCLSVGEWKRTFQAWIDAPQGDALLNACIFFDLRPIYGSEALAERLRRAVLAMAADSPMFLRQMAKDALEREPPLGTIREFVFDGSKEFPGTLDLKLHGSRPFVDSARVLALAGALPHTSTAERLRAAAEAARFDEEGLAGLVDGFYFIHLLRLRNQVRPGGPAGGENRVAPKAMNDLDRQILKEAFRQARKLQNRLVLDYGLRG